MSRDTRTARSLTPQAWLVCFGAASLLGITLAWPAVDGVALARQALFWSAEWR